MDSDNVIGLSKSRYNEFDFIIVSTTHFHHMAGPQWTSLSNKDVANRWIERFDAVLNAEQHKYFYFCAKDDLSGYHVFARNMSEHNRNAEKYRKALNKMKIWK